MNHTVHKQLVHQLWGELDRASSADATQILAGAMHDAAPWYGFDPLLELCGPEALARRWWQPMRQAFPDLKRHTWILIGGDSNGRCDGNRALEAAPGWAAPGSSAARSRTTGWASRPTVRACRSAGASSTASRRGASPKATCCSTWST